MCIHAPLVNGINMADVRHPGGRQRVKHGEGGIKEEGGFSFCEMRK